MFNKVIRFNMFVIIFIFIWTMVCCGHGQKKNPVGCVVVEPHTLLGDLFLLGRGSISSSIFDSASKAFDDEDVDGGGGEEDVWEDGGGGGFFFFLLSFLYMRVGLE